MKKITLTLAVAMALAAGSFVNADAKAPEGGVMPVEAASYNVNKLPGDALKFLREYYGDHFVQSCTNDFDNWRYEVVMSDGTEVEFDYDGRVIEVDSHDTRAIPEGAVKHMLPKDAYKKLSALGIAGQIEGISVEKRGFDVETVKGASLDELFFAKDGHLLAQK